MLQRLCDQREPVSAALSSLQSDVVPLTSTEFAAISKMLTLLQPLKQATTEMTEEQRVSASKPLLRILQNNLVKKLRVLTQEADLQLGKLLQCWLFM